MNQIIKNISYLICYFIQLLASPFYPSKRIAVLLYHSIEPSPWRYSVTPENFKRQISYLHKNFRIVPLAQIVAYLESQKNLPDKTIALTFDDGYLDTYTTVYPLIKKLNIPITVFLTTNLAIQAKLGNLPRPTWSQIKEMRRSGLVQFELHGHNHLNFDSLSPQQLTQEIADCQTTIQNNLGYSAQFLAYPAGRKSPVVIDFLKKNGWPAAFAISEGLIQPHANIFTIKRVQVDKTTNFLLFKLRLTAAIDFHRKIIDWLRPM